MNPLKIFFSLTAIIITLLPTILLASENKPLTLSLNESIILGVRENPNVQSSQLSYTAQKFNLWVQQWQFLPHYSFQA
ncbi:MAG TPA: hypothetical protein VJL60_02920, partial [Gammaproteobacteria bacterium]|nr:hypothetical protein [Gammaproteobacteria bacterium]